MKKKIIITQANIVMLIGLCLAVMGYQYSNNLVVSGSLILMVVCLFLDRLERKYIYKEKKRELK